jgi:hypothetical protein
MKPIASADAATPVTEENTGQETYAVELRSAPDQERFDRSLETLLVNIEADAYGASFQVGDPNENRNQFNNCRGCRLDVQFEVLIQKHQ